MIFQKSIANKKRIIVAISILFLLLVLSFFVLKFWIYSEANSLAKNAIEVFQKDKTESLIAVIDSDRFSLKEKNNAIWALGVLKDKNALLKLESLYTGEECDHNTDLCQYEIEKAIYKINSKFLGSLHVSK